MKAIIASLAGCVLFSVCAPAQNTGSAATSDQAFIELAAQTDMTEAHLGQLAQEKASSQAVKDYGQMLVTDHTADYNTLTALAAKAGLTVPKGLDAKQNKMIAPFEKLQGKAFDRRFAHDMVQGHETAIAAYDKESRDAQNADLKNYATQTLPTLEKHKTAAQGLMGGGSGK